MQKVAAMVDKVAADLGLMASKVRSLLPEKYFEIAATSAACLLLDDNINNNNNINSTTLRPNRTAEQIVVYLNLFLYLCTRFTSKYGIRPPDR